MGEKKFKHVMIDTETLGRTPGSVVRSVAAVEFDPQRVKPGDRRCGKLTLQTPSAMGLR